MSTFDLTRMKAALSKDKSVPTAGGVSSSRKSKPKASSVVKRGNILAEAKSKYTGLPKGPGGAEEQDALLANWAKDGYKFPTTKEIDRHHALLEERGSFFLPTSTNKVARRTAMIAYLKECGIELNPIQLCTLALGTGKFRKAYWICCSLYGSHKRAENSSKTDKLTTIHEGDSDEVKAKKALLLEQSDMLKECQREWQRKIEALRSANSELLGVMEALQVSTDELRDDLTITYPPVESPRPESPLPEGESFPDEGDKGEGDDEGDVYSEAEEP